MNFLRKYWFFLLISVGFVLLMFRAVRITVENIQLAKYGTIATAVIEESEWSSASYKTEDGYYYRFFVNENANKGHTYDKEIAPSDSIMIVYMRRDPTINRPLDFIKRNYAK